MKEETHPRPRRAGETPGLRRLSHAVARYILRSFFLSYFLVSTRPAAHRLRSKSEHRQAQVFLPLARFPSRSLSTASLPFLLAPGGEG